MTGYLTKIGFISLLVVVFNQALGQQASKIAGNRLGVKNLIRSILTNPQNIIAHEKFIDAVGINSQYLLDQYKYWIQKYNTNPVFSYALGKALIQAEDTSGKAYLIKATEINPQYSPALHDLFEYEYGLNNVLVARKYVAQAKAADPKNASYAYEYALTFRDGPEATYDSVLLEITARFPDSEQAALALYDAAGLNYNIHQRKAYYGLLSRMNSKEQLPWVKVGMDVYCNELLDSAPDEAFELALRMVTDKRNNRSIWKKKLELARKLMAVRRALNDGRPKDALSIIQTVFLKDSKANGNWVNADETIANLKAEVLDSLGRTSESVDTLIKFYCKKPTQKAYISLIRYARKVNIDSSLLDHRIDKTLIESAGKPNNFSLKNLASDSIVNLYDYRGKVVLLTFWFPTCGPCLKEFPKFEKVLKKFKNSEVAYLAINSWNQKEGRVLPIIKNGNFSFIPLRDEPNKAKGNLPQVTYAPMNYLLDGEGRVIFSEFFIDNSNETVLEEMIKRSIRLSSHNVLVPGN